MKAKRVLKNKKGFATIESIAMMLILVTLMSFSLGTFGTIHTGILHSIAARAYLFEVMDNRADVNYFRSHPEAVENAGPHRKAGYRYSGITNSQADPTNPRFISEVRNVDFRISKTGINSDSQSSEHSKVYDLNLSERADRGPTNVWVKVIYGICLDASCGGA